MQVVQNQYLIVALVGAVTSTTNVNQTALPLHSSNNDKVIAIDVFLEQSQTVVDWGFGARLRENFLTGENQKGHQLPWIA